MERRLGRGLGSLLSSEPVEGEAPTSIGLDQIRPNPYQPRLHFDEGVLDELVRSIRRHGILQPVVVRKSPSGFELISGERRLRASRQAGRDTIPAIIREDVDDATMLELALVENVQRQDLDAIEKARGFRRMMDKLGLTQEEVAAKVGLRRATISNHVRLLELPEPAQEAIGRGLITMGHAKALLSLPTEAEQLRLMKRIAQDGISVREAERMVRPDTPGESEKGAAQPQGSRASKARPAWANELEERLRESLGTRVTLQLGEGEKGRIAIDFHDHGELNRLLDVLAPKQSV